MVNVLHCTLTTWRGDGELCRWCNTLPRRGGKKFCGGVCAEAYYTNHVYGRSRGVCYRNSIAPCRCKDYQLSTAEHGHCAACKKCEGELELLGTRLTCNHIDPRMGIPTQLIHCIHHIENLEMLCWPCHNELNMRGNKGRPWAT